MKDEIKEIKEILKILKKCEFGACITKHNSRVLLDYITNLQEENEELKKNQRYHKKFGNDYIFCLEGDKETYKDYIFELQERIEKAIELISKEFLCYDNESDEYIQGKKAINILQGD